MNELEPNELHLADEEELGSDPLVSQQCKKEALAGHLIWLAPYESISLHNLLNITLDVLYF
jgi:hypothetical protein